MQKADLLLQFEKLLLESPNFGYLKPEEQQEVRRVYAEANEDTILRGITLLQEDTAATKEIIDNINQEAARQNMTPKQLQLKEKLLEIKQKESKTKTSDQSEAEELLAELQEV